MTAVDDLTTRRLLEAGRSLVSELDTPAVLDRILEAAREVTGARYAALGVLDEERKALAQFLTAGVDQTTRRAIGDLPTGQGVLGVLIQDPRPLRLRNVGEHPQSYGFPVGHPVMQSFLGTPVLIRGEAWGNLYLTEKEGAEEFTEADEEAAVILADWAGAAIENARLYEASERRRDELERVVRGLQATRDIADATSHAVRLEQVLELVAKRGRVLVDARAALIMLRDDEDLVVAASAGRTENAGSVRGRRVPIAGSTSGQVLESGRPERIADVGSRLRISPAELGVPEAGTAVLIPMLHRGVALGVFAVFDHGEDGDTFGETDEQLLHTFAATAANAVAIARSVEADRLRSSIAAADAERTRWARELRDETLERFAGLRVLLVSALQRDDPGDSKAAMREAVEHIEQGLDSLNRLIADLRPVALDELGIAAALDDLVERHRSSAFELVADVQIPNADENALDPELEAATYLLVQEALSNAAKHARPSTVRVVVAASGGEVLVEVEDDGVGFDADAVTDGFGLARMRERAFIAGSALEIDTGERGTRVSARLPMRTDPARVVNRRARGA